MPHNPRPYRPKTRGCFQCSKRRISCDRTEPRCQKCSSKGLECSGLGVRHRFSGGIAVRGFGVGKTAQEVYEKRGLRRRERATSQDQDNPQDEQRGCQSPTRGTTSSDALRRASCAESQTWGETDNSSNGNSTSMMLTDGETLETPSSQVLAAQARVFAFVGGHIQSQPPLSDLDPWEASLVLHFSDHVAGEMVVIDGPHNGWRHLVLPIAHMDPSVMRAVLAAASSHFDGLHGPGILKQTTAPYVKYPGYSQSKYSATQLYSLAVTSLRQRDLATSDALTRLYILLALLTLLVAVMVTGSDDFPTLFRLLESALLVIGGEDQLGHTELADFIGRQVRKMRVYAAPLLDEQSGVAVLKSQKQVTQAFDCLRYCSKHRPEYSSAASLAESLIQQSYDIYLHQAAYESVLELPEICVSSIPQSDSSSRVERFIRTLESFPQNSPGRQVLIWATFVAASDAVFEDHKAFFRCVLEQFYERSRFRNISRGLEHLETTWKRRRLVKRWVSFLPQAKAFIM